MSLSPKQPANADGAYGKLLAEVGGALVKIKTPAGEIEVWDGRGGEILVEKVGGALKFKTPVGEIEFEEGFTGEIEKNGVTFEIRDGKVVEVYVKWYYEPSLIEEFGEGEGEGR